MYITSYDLLDNKCSRFTSDYKRLDKYKVINDLWRALLQIRKPLGAVIRSLNISLHGDFAVASLRFLF